MILLLLQYLFYIFVGVLLYYITKHFLFPNKYRALGIRGPLDLPIIGSAISFFSKGERGFDFHNEATYGKIYSTKQIGFDSISILDLNVLKQILVKEFPNFSNRLTVELNDEYLMKQVTTLKDEEWKRVRNKMTPAFSGAKLKAMMKQLNDCGLTLRQHVLKQPNDVDVKSSFDLFTMDAIASTAFGINIDAASNPDNEFLVAGQEITKLFTKINWKFILLIFVPKLIIFLRNWGFNISLFPDSSMKFYQDVARKTIEERKSSDKTNDRCDFLQMMLEAETDDSNDKTKCISRTEIMAQAILFFFAGFETVSTSLCFLMYNIAKHSDVQENIRKEILEICGNEEYPTYEKINKLEYLEMAIQESLRLYPTASRINRDVRETMEINGIRFLKGTIVDIPIWPIHRNPDIWPEPDEFKPERFSPDQKSERHPLAWLPFGAGPRNCIAQRLAMLEIKVAAYHLIRDNIITPSNKMQANPTLQKLSLLRFIGGTYLDWKAIT